MKQAIAQEVLSAFGNYEPDLPDHSPGKISIAPITGGLINHTYKVSSEYKASFILQRINKNVFKDPIAVQENYINIWEYAEYEATSLRIPAPRYCGKNITLFVDEHENYWRAFEFIENTKTIPVASTKQRAASTAKAFAKFTAAFHDFNVELLTSVIPGFHDLSMRYDQFETAMKGEYYERMSKALPLIDQLKQRERYKHFYEIVTESPEEFPLRVMHHDAKISNVLFNQKTGRVICPIDLDTVMPGYFFSDLGDMIRSMACKKDENSLDFEKLNIRKEFYEIIINSYLEGMKKELTASEKKYIHFSGVLIIYMQTLRFVTDYLHGDVYYQIDYSEQNFDRGMNQFTLLKKLEEFLVVEYGFKV
ncbi:MAG: phosphotransferase [Chitinophagaceae bacterium]